MLKQSIAAASLAALAATIPLRAEIVEQVLVEVNGEIITKTEFEARQVAELRNRPDLAKASAASVELPRAISQITPDLILNAVDELLLIQRGREFGYALGDQHEEAILEVTRQNSAVSQVFDRFSLGVQDSLDSLDDVVAMGQEELKQFDMCLKRHLAGSVCDHRV